MKKSLLWFSLTYTWEKGGWKRCWLAQVKLGLKRRVFQIAKHQFYTRSSLKCSFACIFPEFSQVFWAGRHSCLRGFCKTSKKTPKNQVSCRFLQKPKGRGMLAQGEEWWEISPRPGEGSLESCAVSALQGEGRPLLGTAPGPQESQAWEGSADYTFPGTCGREQRRDPQWYLGLRPSTAKDGGVEKDFG